jgi:hypothetical protein
MTRKRKAARKLMQLAAGVTLAVLLRVLLTSVCAQTDDQALTITSSFAGKESITPTDLLEFKFSRALKSNEEKIAMIIASTDVTNLLAREPDSVSYLPTPFALPVGEIEITIYLVMKDDDWQEVARFALRVIPAGPTLTAPVSSNPRSQSESEVPRRVVFTPSLTLGFKSQAAETHFPASNRPERPTFFDTTLQASLKSEMKRDRFQSETQFDFAGASFGKEALRFSLLGDQAPKVDLANYLMQLQFGRSRFTSGHTSFGSNRHLINSFASRGLTLSIPVGKRDDFSFASLNGTSIVGFGNFFGLNNRHHQVFSAAWGHEFLPERPGGLRTEVSFLEGSLLPQVGVNQGAITDREKSQGYGFRLIASDKNQRAKFDGGITRSRFTNPPDPLLNRGQSIVLVQEVARNARFVDVSYDVLRDVAITKTKKLTFNAAYHYEQVDPLFRSVAATTQADRFNNQWDVAGNLDQLNFTLTHQRFNDNLANIPSILKSLTRRSAATINTPLQAFIGIANKPSPWLPRVGFSYDRVHQFGNSLPINGGFEVDPSTVPNQLSLNQAFTAEWQFTKYRLGYRFNRSAQDNRQAGREIADLYNTINGITFGFTPNSRVDLNFDMNSERARNRENQRTDQTWRFGLNANLQITKNTSLSATLSTLNAFDLGQVSDNFTNEFNLQWSWRFLASKSQFRKVQGQFFLRYATFLARAIDRSFETNNLTKNQTLNAGMNFTFF